MMRFAAGLFLGALVALLWANAEAATWFEGTRIGVRMHDAYDSEPGAFPLVFANSYSYPQINPAGQWHRVEVASAGIPDDVQSVFVTGRLVITHGTNPETCDLTVAFRAPGAWWVGGGDFLGQAVEAQVGAGIRSTFALFVPVREGAFEWQWGRSTGGSWSRNCAYGVFLYPQAYVR